MNSNPFAGVIHVIREDNRVKTPTSYRIGEVKSVSPLVVNVAGTDQEADDLLKNELITSPTAGDILLLLPIENEQRYIIICKVVRV